MNVFISVFIFIEPQPKKKYSKIYLKKYNMHADFNITKIPCMQI